MECRQSGTLDVCQVGPFLNWPTYWTQSILFLECSQNCEIVAISFVMSVCPYGSSRLALDGFSRDLILQYFLTVCREISISLKYYENNGHFTWRTPCTFDHLSLSVLLRMGNISDKGVEKVKIYILFSVIFFFENLAVYEITWKHMVQPDRLQMKCIMHCMLDT